VLQGERRYDLVMRYLPKYRDTKEAIENIRLLAPCGERVALPQLCKIAQRDGASEIYREGNQRYIATKYSVRDRDLSGAVEEAIQRVNAQVQLPRGYHIDWEGEYESEKRAEERLLVIVPLTILLIFIILYTMFRSLKWALLILANVPARASVVCWRCSSPARSSACRLASASSHSSASLCKRA
jgi:heavy metal efflux system protein